jgi:hypothetical protein
MQERDSRTMPPPVDAHDEDHETGFGTGLRAQLERRREPHAAAEEDVAPPGPALPVEESRGDDALRRELEEALAREASLRRALADHSLVLTRVTELQEELVAREQEVELLRRVAEAGDSEPDESARDFLRRRAERQAELVWQAFEGALGAARPDGQPDHRLRLDAARALLAEAYDRVRPAPELVRRQAEDELADLRARRAGTPPTGSR